MNKKLYLVAACGLLATVLACSDKSSSPAAPTPVANGAGSNTPATADGTTLKVPAPTPVSPANGATLEDFNIVLKVNPVTAKYADVSQFAYRFQILLNNQVVKEFRTSTTTQWTVTDLENNTTYTWHARAELGTNFGPWSDGWTFKTPEIPEGYINGGELYDPLFNGKTVGVPHGAVSFIPGVGVKLEGLTSYIEYHLGQTVAGGEFSVLVTSLEFNTEGDKTKIMAMKEGTNPNDITTNDRRFTIEKRGNPAGTVAWRVRTSNDQIDTQGAERVVRHFDPSHTYFWKATWGGNRFNLLIKDGGVNGSQIYSFGKGYGGVYDPNPHVAYIGGPGGRAGADSGTVPGIVVRQVWLSSRPRPSFANK
jgi:hypothetical protein